MASRTTGAASDNLSGCLRSLRREDLAAVLQNRPEAAAAAASGGGLERLSGVLADPRGVWHALARLDRFRLQVLVVAAWFGPRAPLSFLATQAPGASEDDIAAAVRSLEQHALAFRIDSTDGPKLWVPPCVARVEAPLGPGTRLGSLLQQASSGELAAIGERLGLALDKNSRCSELLPRLATHLSDPGVVEAVLSSAPEGVGEALAVVRTLDGRASWGELSRLGVADQRDLAAVYRRHRARAATPLEWLCERGLLVSSETWDGGPGVQYLVPGEVECALRGGLLFSEWHPTPPLAATMLGDARPDRAPDEVLGDAAALLHEWTDAPAQPLKVGGLGKRELKKAAQRTGIDERLAAFLYALLAEAKLLCYRGGKVTASDAATEWLEQAPAARWAVLFDAWRQALLWSESGEGLVKLSDQPVTDYSRERAAVLNALLLLEGDEAVTEDALGELLEWTSPTLFYSRERASALARRVVEGLAWLGTARATPAIQLCDPARSLLADPNWAGNEEADGLFGAPVAECTVQADLTVIVPGRPVPELGRGLASFCDLEASSPAAVYRISDASVRRALDLGVTGDEMLSLLERYAAKEIPQPVRYLIEDAARRHGRVKVGSGGVYVRADDAGLLAEIVGDRRVKKLRPKVLAPTVAVMREASEAVVLKLLRDAGYMPVADDGGAAVARAGGKQTPIYRRAEVPVTPELPPARARELAEKLLSAPAPEQPRARPGFVATEAILRLLRLAERGGARVEIGYGGSDGIDVYEVEPLDVQKKKVIGWTSDRGEMRAFSVARIQWARPISEGTVDFS